MHARRDILKSVGVLPLAAVLACPMRAQAAASTLSEISLTLSGGDIVKAAIAYPNVTPAPAVLLIHEWWGLNNQIKAVAAELARMGYVAIAVDLYDGNVAKTPDDARKYMKMVAADKAMETLKSWVDWSRSNQKTTDKLATIGWCFGGGWSLNASIGSSVDATIIYYGNVARNVADLKNLNGPVLGHFAMQDKWINQNMVGEFYSEMQKAGQPIPEIHWYDADHAFANPSGGRYDEEDAKLSWERTTEFLKLHLS